MGLKKIIAVLLIFTLIIIGALYFLGSQAPQTYPPSQEDFDEADSDETDGTEDGREERVTPALYDGEFDLPIEGAAGYTSIDIPLFVSPDNDSIRIRLLEAGTAFMIVAEEGDWWQIETEESSGWIEHTYAFINLPDVLTSVIYDNTNSYASVFTSSYHELPDITGQPLYQAIDFNERLDKEEFIMPVLYATAKKLSEAQSKALNNGEGLIIYETYRPFETQNLVAQSVAELAEENEDVYEGLNREPWTQAWFIITDSLSNHQIGVAIDASLINIESMEEVQYGDYLAPTVTAYTEYQMQTPIHELSADSVIFEERVPSDSKVAWLEQSLVDEVTDASIRLQQYMTLAGFTPIASEWWHFNDLDAVDALEGETGKGNFYLTHTLNKEPRYHSNE